MSTGESKLRATWHEVPSLHLSPHSSLVFVLSMRQGEFLTELPTFFRSFVFASKKITFCSKPLRQLGLLLSYLMQILLSFPSLIVFIFCSSFRWSLSISPIFVKTPILHCNLKRTFSLSFKLIPTQP
jgi:hypothetical protein